MGRVLQSGDFIPFMALRGESYVPVYYPGTTDRRAARAIEVGPGALVGGIDFVTATKK